MPHVLSGCDARSLARPFPRGFVPTNVGHLIIIIIISPLMMDGRRDSGNGGEREYSGNGVPGMASNVTDAVQFALPWEMLR